MTKVLRLSLVALCLSLTCHAAPAPKVAWSYQAGGAKHDKIRALAVDDKGSTFITGEFTEAADFGVAKVAAVGGLDFVVAKLDVRGKPVWVSTAGGDKIDRGYAVAVAKDGSVYVTGHFQSDTITFGDTTLRNRGDYDVFVVKYDTAGRPVWARSAGGKAYDFGHGIAVTPVGDVLVSGAIRAEGDFGDGLPTTPGNVGPFVACYSADGDLRWTRCMTGKGSGSGHEIAVDGNGAAFLGGYFSGTTELGGRTLKVTKGRDLFAARLNADGAVDWVFQGGSAADGLVSGIAADGHGGCYIGGMFKATARFGEQSFTSAGDNDFFLARVGADGSARWVVSAGGKGIDYGLGVASDTAGNALLTGETTGDVQLLDHSFRAIGKRDLYAAKFNPSGKLIWAWQAGGTLNGLSYTAGCGPRGLNVIAGAFSGDLNVGGKKLVSRGSNDIIVVGLQD